MLGQAKGGKGPVSSDHVDVQTAAAIARAGLARAGRSPGGRPPADTCARCGAEFRWDRAPVGGGWVMRLVKAGKGCDCGYGLPGAPPLAEDG